TLIINTTGNARVLHARGVHRATVPIGVTLHALLCDTHPSLGGTLDATACLCRLGWRGIGSFFRKQFELAWFATPAHQTPPQRQVQRACAPSSVTSAHCTSFRASAAANPRG